MRAAAPTRLPVVVATISASGTASITIDGDVQESDPIERADLSRVVDEVAARVGPIRVEIHEADGSIYTDLVVPDQEPAPQQTAEQPRQAPETPATPTPTYDAGQFLAGEELYVAVIVADQRADEHGRAELRLPPALRGRAHGIVALLGRSSGSFTIYDEP